VVGERGEEGGQEKEGGGWERRRRGGKKRMDGKRGSVEVTVRERVYVWDGVELQQMG
jgi:hypothetical protein